MNNAYFQIITPNRSDDNLNALCKVEHLAWSSPGENIEANRVKIEARVRSFQTGVSLALVEDKAAGSQYSFTFEWNNEVSVLTTWDELTSYGWINKVHKDGANTGFLVGVGVCPEFRRQKFMSNIIEGERRISELLIIYTLQKLFNIGVTQVIACARIPLYYTKPSLDVYEYCSLKGETGEPYDPVLRFHKRLGADFIKPVPYAMEDAESQNGGCWVIYKSVPGT